MSHTILFENAQLFDGATAELQTPAFVLVEGEEIKEVSSRSIRTESSERVDCRGQTLMPGLIDNHVHVYLDSINLGPPEPPMSYRAHYARTFLREALVWGVTTVRDVAGGDHGLAMALRNGLLEGPRFFYGGLCLTQTGGHGDMRTLGEETDYCACGAERNAFAIRADGVDECVKATREELRKGASHIKIMASGGVLSPSDPLERCQYSEAEIRAIVDECARHGAYVCAHCYPAEGIRRCVEYGVRSIEHGTLIDEETATVVVARGAYVVPTMAMLFAHAADGERIPEVSRQKLRRVHDFALRSLEVMKRAGVKMGFGTDLLGDQNARRGMEFTLRREVLSPFEILHSATSVNAEILQMQGKLGVIRPGALADLLVVDGNPLADLACLAQGGRYLTHIMVGGRFMKRTG
jgi:imidazolonepropionase-like amidohydrolase